MRITDEPGAELFCREQGEGPPVILLHGSVSSGRQWASLAAHLEKRFRVFSPDLPGYGLARENPVSTAEGLKEHVRAVLDVAEAAGEPVHLVGHSFGGAVALSIAAARPHAIASLSIIEPAAFHLLRDGDIAEKRLFARIRSVADTVAACVAADDPQTALARFIDFWHGKGAWDTTLLDDRQRMIGGVNSILSDFKGLFGETWSIDACKDFHFPVLSIMGVDSVDVTQRLSEMIAEAAPRGQLHMVFDAGHMLPVTHAHIVNPIIAGHLHTAETSLDLRRRRSKDGTIAA